jgi:proteasome lid subunit RPN8/RPN11
VTIVQHDRIIYQHPHTVTEIVAAPLQRHLREALPQITDWGFRLVGPGMEGLSMVRPTPEVVGLVNIAANSGRRRTTHVEEVPEPDPPVAALADLGVGEPGRSRGGSAERLDATLVAVVFRPTAYRSLTGHEFSSVVEEGGFVIGHRHADAERPGRHLLEVTAVVTAESTGASLLRFTFTGESFLRLSNLLARRGLQEQILGWYHTHLFAATPDFGLSTVDVRLHTTTFRRPWQVAVLLNLDQQERVLRVYGSAGDGMTELPFWLAEGRHPEDTATQAADTSPAES